MTMPDHSPEIDDTLMDPTPWHTPGCLKRIGRTWAIPVWDARGTLVATTMRREVAERIVACANACKGIPTEDLEKMDGGELSGDWVDGKWIGG